MKRFAFFAAAAVAAGFVFSQAPAASGEAKARRLAEGAQVSFKIVKDGDVEVGGKFETVTGKVDVAGFPALGGAIKIDLASLDMKLKARTQNVKEYFFGVTDASLRYAHFRPAKFTGPAVDLAAFAEPVTGALEGTLEVAGGSAAVSIPVMLSPAEGKAVRIASTSPAIVSIAALAMEDEKARMMAVCHHNAVEDTVRVTIDVTLKP